MGRRFVRPFESGVVATTCRTVTRGRVRFVAAAFAVAFGSIGPVAAAEADLGGFAQLGAGDRAVRNATLGLTRSIDASTSTAASRWSFYGEAALGEWFTHGRDSGQRSRFTRIGLTPVVRYRFAGPLFVEAGIGLNVIVPEFRDGNRSFSTTFNFGDHVAIGTRFGADDANEVALRVEHYSNGGIRQPNPGQNFVSLRYARHF